MHATRAIRLKYTITHVFHRVLTAKPTTESDYDGLTRQHADNCNEDCNQFMATASSEACPTRNKIKRKGRKKVSALVS